ncbi:MAG: helix-turn-helix transcriptional regulator [bacterium]|nr:helix-turn-helix transcriptional regulator [bacterium]
MLNIGDKIILFRKQKGWSQGDLAKKIGSSREMVGKYERDDNLPSIEMTLKIAKAFEVTVDFLIGEGEFASFDKRLMDRIKAFENLDEGTKTKIFDMIDVYIRDAKARKAYS